jgi:hypothetical protein
MSQGIASALTHLETMIMEVSPKRDVHQGFVALSRADGATSPLSQRAHSNRFFTLEIEGFTEDDGAAGLSGRRRAVINLNVRYDIPRDPLYLQRMIAEDADSLLVRLKGPEYDLINTGIVSVIPEAPSLTDVDPTIESGSVILTLPFTLLYLEA